jgi:nucleotide-binding universal stress UspA family protein
MGLGNPYVDAASTSIVEVQKNQQSRANRTAEAAASELKQANPRLAVEAIAVSGDPRDVIVQKASDWNADLIVLGSHGRTGLQRWLLGSVAESVVRHAPCSVQVARAPRRA